MFLIVWAQDGIISGSKLRWRLAHFVVPSALTLAVLTGVVYWGFERYTSDVAYAELAVTYALLIAGLFRILFLQPPTPFWTGGEQLRGDRRVVVLVFGIVALFAAVMAVPIFREWLRLDFLSPAYDYLVVAGAAVLWAAVLRTTWRTGALDWLSRAVTRLAGR
jgi:cation-transporting ATPase E